MLYTVHPENKQGNQWKKRALYTEEYGNNKIIIYNGSSSTNNNNNNTTDNNNNIVSITCIILIEASLITSYILTVIYVALM